MVQAWRETVSIPTYEVGEAEKNPIFLEKRVYQGSSGVVYPYPVIESIANEAKPKEWHVVWLENEYIKVMIMPELGGRIQMAYDKVKERHFVYYNHVIKPALVGLTGPWISGGIEFNWPQHHRPSTYLPIDCTIEEANDGSVTVWCNEMERMFHQKGLVGFTLRPGCAYLEIQGRLSNRTPLPQTFLWWANPAVEVNDAYQTVFPPDVNAVFDHGKRDVSTFPIATGTYYKMDYSAGVDISNYKNIKVPTSYMAVNSKYDFEGGYENDTQGGMLHVASHHFSPGKKQWTWGNGDFGRAWDRNLTDSISTPNVGEQGEGLFRPYIELMAGVYTENQPDFTWLMPYEEKQFTQYFMPYRELGIVKQATKDFIFNIEETQSEGGQKVSFKLLATSRQQVQILLKSDSEVYYDKVVTLSPEEVLTEEVNVKGAKLSDLTFLICREQPALVARDPRYPYKGIPVLTWHAEPDEERPIPDAAEAALPPAATKTNDQLYLTGLHLEQYRHATWSALDYYEEALRRDPDDVRCLNQTGLWYLRRGRFDKAEGYLRRAVKIWQKRNPNPYDGEPLFNLGLCLKYLGQVDWCDTSRTGQAYDFFWKSTWSKAWADAGYFEAACISVSELRLDDAQDELNRCLIANSHNHKARALKAAVLRLQQEARQKGGMQMGSSKDLNDRLALIKESLQMDTFNYGILYEQYLLTKEKDVLKQLIELMHGNVYNYHELAWDYAQAGLWLEAEQVLTIPAVAKKLVSQSPLTNYYLAYFKIRQGDAEAANSFIQQAEATNPDYCFPNRLEDIVVLETAKTVYDKCAKAPYYLGCLYYDKRQYDLAIANWERSAQFDPQFPTVWRNLALAAYNKQQDSAKAVDYMERAFNLDKKDARILMELDQLYKRLQRPHAQRLAFLQNHPKLIQRRDDLVLEEITLLNQTGHYKEAMAKLDARHFHPWEGGEGKVPAQYQMCRVEMAKSCLADNPEQAIRLLEECLVYPPHLGEGKLYGAQDNDFHYLLGLANERKGNKEEARRCYEKATVGPTDPAAAMYYNDAKPDKIFYAALAYHRLAILAAEESTAGTDNESFNRKSVELCNVLLHYGQQHLHDKQTMDYFAVSLPDLLVWDGDLDARNIIHCNLMMALGHIGLSLAQVADAANHREQGLSLLEEVERLDINHPVPPALRSLLSLHVLTP